MCLYGDLFKGAKYRVFERHVCSRMFYVGHENGKEYFSEYEGASICDSYNFKKWESI